VTLAKAARPSAFVPLSVKAVSYGPAQEVVEGAQPTEAEMKAAPGGQGEQLEPDFPPKE